MSGIGFAAADHKERGRANIVYFNIEDARGVPNSWTRTWILLSSKPSPCTRPTERGLDKEVQ